MESPKWTELGMKELEGQRKSTKYPIMKKIEGGCFYLGRFEIFKKYNFFVSYFS